MTDAINLTQGFEFTKSIFVDTTMFNIDWLISTFIILLILIIITRDISEWKILAFPVTIVVHIMGLKPSILWYFIVAILFAIEIFSSKMTSGILRVFNRKSRNSLITNTPYGSTFKDMMKDASFIGKYGYNTTKKGGMKIIDKTKSSKDEWLKKRKQNKTKKEFDKFNIKIIE